MESTKDKRNVSCEETRKELCLKLPNEKKLEIKYKKLIRVIRKYEGQEDGFLDEVEKHCPSSVTKFIERFAALFGAHATAYWVAEILLKGQK